MNSRPFVKCTRSFVFSVPQGLYPMDQSEYPALRSAIERLTLNDSSVSVQRDSSMALGAGWRWGGHSELVNGLTHKQLKGGSVDWSVTVSECAKLMTKAPRFIRRTFSGDASTSDDFLFLFLFWRMCSRAPSIPKANQNLAATHAKLCCVPKLCNKL